MRKTISRESVECSFKYQGRFTVEVRTVELDWYRLLISGILTSLMCTTTRDKSSGSLQP